VSVSRPRWSPRKRIRLFGGRAFGVVLNLSRGKQDGPGPSGLIRGFLHSGWSLSFNLLGATFNTRGRYSIDGPGVADFRGTWKNPSVKTRRESRAPAVNDNGEIHGRAPRRARGTNPHLCGMRWHGGAPCILPADHEDEWHFPGPASGEPAWKFTADTSRPWWRR
jgi:hypothetical protein